MRQNNLGFKKTKSIKKIRRSVVQFLFFVAMLLLMQNVSNAQSAAEQKCFDAVQGKVAYNQAGNKSWSADNIRKLC